MRNNPGIFDVVCALALYLRANPLACDSLEGISRWWLASQVVTPDELEQALGWMRERGLIEELVAADGRLRYRRCGREAMLQAAIDEYCDVPVTRH